MVGLLARVRQAPARLRSPATGRRMRGRRIAAVKLHVRRTVRDAFLQRLHDKDHERHSAEKACRRGSGHVRARARTPLRQQVDELTVGNAASVQGGSQTSVPVPADVASRIEGAQRFQFRVEKFPHATRGLGGRPDIEQTTAHGAFPARHVPTRSYPPRQGGRRRHPHRIGRRLAGAERPPKAPWRRRAERSLHEVTITVAHRSENLPAASRVCGKRGGGVVITRPLMPVLSVSSAVVGGSSSGVTPLSRPMHTGRIDTLVFSRTGKTAARRGPAECLASAATAKARWHRARLGDGSRPPRAQRCNQPATEQRGQRRHFSLGHVAWIIARSS